MKEYEIWLQRPNKFQGVYEYKAKSNKEVINKFKGKKNLILILCTSCKPMKIVFENKKYK